MSQLLREAEQQRVMAEAMLQRGPRPTAFALLSPSSGSGSSSSGSPSYESIAFQKMQKARSPGQAAAGAGVAAKRAAAAQRTAGGLADAASLAHAAQGPATDRRQRHKPAACRPEAAAMETQYKSKPAQSNAFRLESLPSFGPLANEDVGKDSGRRLSNTDSSVSTISDRPHIDQHRRPPKSPLSPTPARSPVKTRMMLQEHRQQPMKASDGDLSAAAAKVTAATIELQAFTTEIDQLRKQSEQETAKLIELQERRQAEEQLLLVCGACSCGVPVGVGLCIALPRAVLNSCILRERRCTNKNSPW